MKRLTFLLVTTFLWCTSLSAVGQTISTDKDDYEPGETVTFNGDGFSSGETVGLLASGNTNMTQVTHQTVADELGAIAGSFAIPLIYEEIYELTATGQSSGIVAQTTFLDSFIFVIDAPTAIAQSMTCSTTKDFDVRARVSGSGGNVAGVTVKWTTTHGSMSPTQNVTLANGRARSTHTTGLLADSYDLIADAINVSTGAVIHSAYWTITTSGPACSQPPVILCPPPKIVNNAPGQNGATVTMTGATATGSPAPTYSYSPPTGFFPLGTTSVIATATNTAGTDDCSFDVTVNDNEAPVISVMPANLTLYTGPGDMSCMATGSWSVPTATDNSGTATPSSNYEPGDSMPLGATTVTYTFTDPTGNAKSASFVVTVIDNTAPEIAGLNDVSEGTGPGNPDPSVAVNWALPTASDNCGTANITGSSHNPGAIFPIGPTTVTYNAQDNAGNPASGTFVVTVVDDTPPVIANVPADMTVYTGVGDNTCTAPASWTPPSATDNGGSAGVSPSHTSGGSFPLGVTTVTFTATDLVGNMSDASFDITVVDDTKPVLAGLVDMTVGTGPGNPNPHVAVNWNVTASDNCDGPVTPVGSFNSGDSFAIGTHTVDYTAEDAAGNQASGSFMITVVDDTPPVIADVPADMTIYTGVLATTCSANGSWTGPTVTDNSGVAPTLTPSHTSPSSFNLGLTTVSFTATDGAGNSANASFEVTLEDNTDPVLSGVPGNITMGTGPGNPGPTVAVNWAAPTGTDNCGTATVTGSHASGDAFSIGTHTVTYTVVDGANNQSMGSFDVTVVDDTDPVIVGLSGNITKGTGVGNPLGSVAVSWTVPTATDNGGTATVSGSHNPGDVFPVGTTTVTYTAEDLVGNTSSGSFDVTVVDDTPPVISGLASNLSFAVCEAIDLGTPTVTDNYDTNPIVSNTASSPFSVGSTVVVWTAKDAANNSSMFSQTVAIGYGDAEGFLSPMSMDGTAIKIKKGRTVPVKFRLIGCPSTNNAVAHIFYQMVNDNNIPTGDPLEAVSTSGADTGNLFRSTGDGQYHYNLNTSSSAWVVGKKYLIIARLADGQEITGFISVTK